MTVPKHSMHIYIYTSIYIPIYPAICLTALSWLHKSFDNRNDSSFYNRNNSMTVPKHASKSRTQRYIYTSVYLSLSIHLSFRQSWVNPNRNNSG